MTYNLLTVSGDAKTIKGEHYGYLTGVMYGIPGEFDGHVTCPFASPECLTLCLRESGHLRFEKNKAVARRKMNLLFFQPEEFGRVLTHDILGLIDTARRKGLKPAVRLNGTTDLNVHVLFRNIIECFPGVQFYDYTKRPPQSWGELPANYHLTFSLSELNERHALKAIDMGFNVAVAFHGKLLPTTYWGRPVINGDDSDLRFLDNIAYPPPDTKGQIIGLTAKGIARKAPYGPNHFIK